MDTKPPSFLRTYVLPALFLFALPAFAYWFSGHATAKYDDLSREAALSGIASDKAMSETERAEARAFYENVPLSRICAEAPEEELSEGTRDACSSYGQFRIARLTAAGSLALGALSVVFVLLCAALSFANRTLQYASFVAGWNFLRLTSALQTIAQGALAVWLSYWMTVIWFERYVPKLILIVGVVAAVAMFLVVKAIFQGKHEPLFVEGELVSESAAPELWGRVRALCERMGTSPPDHIVGGIDDNFFVTEGEVRLDNQVYRGRTLFVSLSLLRTLDRAEADAILAHEMAHFSGGDTAFSRKLVPRLNHYLRYLEALKSGGISIPVYFFMLFYWALFQLSLGKSRREREFRADALAAEQTAPEHIAHSLVKVAAYSSYRGRVESQLFEHDKKLEEVGIVGRVLGGFSSYVASEHLVQDLEESSFPHPFDSHPTLEARLEAVGVRLDPAARRALLETPATSTWLSAIGGGEAIEARLWNAYEARFAAAHEQSLAYRYAPSGEEEKRIVVKYFPPVEIHGGKNGPLTIDYTGLRFFGNDEFLGFDEIAGCSVEDAMFKKHLKIQKKPGLEPKKLSICLSDLQYDSDAFLELFNRYYGRHQYAANQRT